MGNVVDKVRFIWDRFLPRFLSFMVFAISKSPQSYASAALHMRNRRERRDVTSVNEPRWTGGRMTQPSEPWSGWWSRGLARGRLQGSPAPRQMCLGVIPHPQRNESPNRCLTSRPGCHASQTHTHTNTHTRTHQPCKDMHTHSTIYYYIGKIGSTRGQVNVHLELTLTKNNKIDLLNLHISFFFKYTQHWAKLAD